MYYSERYDKILDILKKRTVATVHYLAEQLYVSEPTIRRDLNLLEKQGKIKRTFGGAMLNATIQKELPLVVRERENIQAKRIIAEKASAFLKNGQVIFLDASSTVAALLPYLSDYQDLTVITNSPKAPLELAKMSIKSISTGGSLLANSLAYIGNHAEDVIRKYNADVFFFSCRGLSEKGWLTDASPEETEIRKIMMAQSKKKIFLCTTDKIGKEYMCNLCETSDLDTIIFEEEPPEF